MKRSSLIDGLVWLILMIICAICEIFVLSPTLPVTYHCQSILLALLLGFFWVLFRDLGRRTSVVVGWLSLGIFLSLLAPFAAYFAMAFLAELFRLQGSRIILYPLLLAGGFWGPLSEVLRFRKLSLKSA